jgi:hypothetical protein
VYDWYFLLSYDHYDNTLVLLQLLGSCVPS